MVKLKHLVCIDIGNVGGNRETLMCGCLLIESGTHVCADLHKQWEGCCMRHPYIRISHASNGMPLVYHMIFYHLNWITVVNNSRRERFSTVDARGHYWRLQFHLTMVRLCLVFMLQVATTDWQPSYHCLFSNAINTPFDEFASDRA